MASSSAALIGLRLTRRVWGTPVRRRKMLNAFPLPPHTFRVATKCSDVRRNRDEPVHAAVRAPKPQLNHEGTRSTTGRLSIATSYPAEAVRATLPEAGVEPRLRPTDSGFLNRVRWFDSGRGHSL